EHVERAVVVGPRRGALGLGVGDRAVHRAGLGGALVRSRRRGLGHLSHLGALGGAALAALGRRRRGRGVGAGRRLASSIPAATRGATAAGAHRQGLCLRRHLLAALGGGGLGVALVGLVFPLVEGDRRL